MTVSKAEIILIINTEKLEDRRARAYTQSLPDIQVNERDVTQNPFTATQLASLADDMKMPISGLIDKTSSVYHNKLENSSFKPQELAEIVSSNPGVLRTPIIKANGQTFFVDSSFSMIKKALMFKSVSSPSASRGER